MRPRGRARENGPCCVGEGGRGKRVIHKTSDSMEGNEEEGNKEAKNHPALT